MPHSLLFAKRGDTLVRKPTENAIGVTMTLREELGGVVLVPRVALTRSGRRVDAKSFPRIEL